MKAVKELFFELYTHRALIRALVVRHLSSRYRGSVLGFLWSFLNPLCLMLVYMLVFQYYQRIAIENYSIFLFCGLLPWLWISSALIEGTCSIVSSGHLITKSMFPAQVLPAVAVLTALVNYLLSLPLLLIIMWCAGLSVPLTVLAVPLVCVLMALFLFGMSLCLSAWNVAYRDVQHVVGNLLTLLFFLCPILYDRATVPERFQFTLDFNPLALLTESFHQLLLKGELPSLWALLFVLGSTCVVLLIGTRVFVANREHFAEAL